jgi:hypothetical protein
MDAIRRAKIEVLIPILEAVEEAVRDLVSEKEDAVHGTHGNLGIGPFPINILVDGPFLFWGLALFDRKI